MTGSVIERPAIEVDGDSNARLKETYEALRGEYRNQHATSIVNQELAERSREERKTAIEEESKRAKALVDREVDEQIAIEVAKRKRLAASYDDVTAKRDALAT